MPDRKPSTTCRARSSSRAIRAIASGCKNLLEPDITGELVFLGGGNVKQAIDNVVGRDSFAFGSEIQHQAVAQHRLGERLNILGGDVRATVQQRASFRPQ